MSTAIDVDVLIIGAGLSGIAAGSYVSTRLPGKTFFILEARDALGGTWDLFRYPGIRSDSDMHTLGYSFRPWRGDVSLADGPSIKAYIRETASDFGLDTHIRYGRRAVRAEWSSELARWTVHVLLEGAAEETYTCRFLYACSGYYDYASGYLPDWSGIDAFAGTIVHPQAWPQSLNYAGKRVIVIGSGATAVTIVPAMAKEASHVTMLQRSPTYIVSLPSHDAVARAAYALLPSRAAHAFVRWKNVLLQMFFYNLMRRRPEFAKRRIKDLIRKELGPQFDVDRHFSPSYNPWDQRLCLVPEGDLFEAIREGRVSVATGEIERFTKDGILLRSGEELHADIIVTATGLNVRLLGGMELIVDGAPVVPRDSIAYKGMMFCGVPNFALALGYTNASWTLKCELTSRYVCRLLRYMDRHGYVSCSPAAPGDEIGTEPAISLTSGYIARAASALPKQGSKTPWKLHQNYALDLAELRFGRMEDGVMEFARA